MADETQAQQSAPEAAVVETSEFDSLLNETFKPKTEERKSAIQEAVTTLAEQALANTALISDDAIKSIQSIIAAIDEKLTEQVNLIMHHEDFQKLEGAWRGLSYLINNTETDEMLKVRVMDISKKDLRKTLKRFKGVAWDQSPIFKKLYESEYGMLGGEPYGCLVGDYHFSHLPADVELLQEISQVAAASHAPFIAGADPTVMDMESWQQLNDKRDLTKVFSTPEYAPWRSFRDSDDSRYVGLAMPRFLSRLPYGSKTEPVEEFAFEEETNSGDHSKYTWSNSAYAMAANINQAFKAFGWCTQIRGIESGGEVLGLPCHTFPTDDGKMDMKCPTEIGITKRREAELAKNGFMPLCHEKNTDNAFFIGAQSLQKPVEFDDDDATANARLSANLPYMFATCRFAHYLNKMVYAKVGSSMEQEELKRWLNDWVLQYVDGDPAHSSQDTKARKPLAAAEVEVEEIEGDPGAYNARFLLRPHYQLEKMTASLRLVSKLPSLKAGG